MNTDKPKPLSKSLQTPLSDKDFAKRVIKMLNETFAVDSDHADRDEYTTYDDDRRKWEIIVKRATDGFVEAHGKSMYPYTDGSYADFDGSAVGTKRGWFEIVDGEWVCVDCY